MGGDASLDFSNALIEGAEFSLAESWVTGGDINFESAQFDTAVVSFHNSRLSEGYFNFKNVVIKGKEVSFKNCRFGNGIKDFQYSSFGVDHISFVNAEFGDGDVNFINAQFDGSKVSFKIARFGKGKVDFHFAAFRKVDLSFERTEFGPGRVNFRTVEFGKGRVSFKRALLGSGAFSFEEVMFENVDVSFERTQFGEERVSFYKSWFRTLSLGFCHLNGFIDLRVNRSHTIDLSNTVVRDIIDMNPHDFTTHIDTLYMGGMRLLGRFYLDWYRNNVKQMLNRHSDHTHRVRAEQFRILKENFKNLGLYNAEDKAYVEFKRCESKADLTESVKEKPLTAIYKYPFYWFKLGLFDRAGLYATSPVRVLITMLTCFVVFSLVYYFMLLWSSA